MDPVTFAWAIAFLVASFAITALTAKAPKNAEPAAFDEFQFPQSAEGTPQQVIFGDCWTSDWTVLATTNLRNDPIRAKSASKI